jgi:phosphatidylglycerophosphate synthase
VIDDLRQTTPTRARAWVGVALALDLVGIGGWLVAFYGPFPPHPWIFVLFAAFSLACGLAGIVLATIGHTRSAKRSWRGVAAIAFGVAPLVVILVVHVVALIDFALTVNSG